HDHLRPAEERRTPNRDGRARREPVVVAHVIVGEIRDRAQIVRGDVGREEERWLAADEYLELREMPRAAVEEPELLLHGEWNVTRLIENRERVAVRQDVLAPSTRQRRREHVVLVAHPYLLGGRCVHRGRRPRCHTVT